MGLAVHGSRFHQNFVAVFMRFLEALGFKGFVSKALQKIVKTSSDSRWCYQGSKGLFTSLCFGLFVG